MRVREIENFAPNTLIELPNTDACAILSVKKHLEAFVKMYGNVEVVQVGTNYQVPAFAESRKQFIAAKLAFLSK